MKHPDPAALVAAVVAALVSWTATFLSARAARRAAFVDAPAGEDADRKLQPVPVPPVGGPAIFLGLLAAWALDAPSRPHAAVAVALVLALATGLVDDARRLSARAKLAGQSLAGVALAWPSLVAGDLGEAVLLALGAVVCQNALNTFDNADGAAGGSALLGFAAAGSSLAGALAGFLPHNLSRGRAPRAYLGDSGSHLCGLLLFVVPGAWPGLVLPCLDLARVAWVRMDEGRPPWRGDRAHLAHRLERAGLGPLAVAALLGAIAVPAVLAGSLSSGTAVRAAGVVATCVLFLVAVRATRNRGAIVPPPGGGTQ